MKKIIIFLILIIVFSMSGVFVHAWADNDNPSQNVDGCGEITTNGATYTMTDSIEDESTTCFTIIADNVVAVNVFLIETNIPCEGVNTSQITSKSYCQHGRERVSRYAVLGFGRIVQGLKGLSYPVYLQEVTRCFRNRSRDLAQHLRNGVYMLLSLKFRNLLITGDQQK